MELKAKVTVIPTFRAMIAFFFQFLSLLNHEGNKVQGQTVAAVVLAGGTGRV